MRFKYKELRFNKRLSSLLIIFMSTHTLAADNIAKSVMNVAETLAFDAKHYAASYGVTLDEAMRRLLIMHDTNNQVASLNDQYKNVLSGIYFDNGSDFGLKINVVGNNHPQQIFKLEKSLIAASNF